LHLHKNRINVFGRAPTGRAFHYNLFSYLKRISVAITHANAIMLGRYLVENVYKLDRNKKISENRISITFESYVNLCLILIPFEI
jgi:hypothetical protein